MDGASRQFMYTTKVSKSMLHVPDIPGLPAALSVSALYSCLTSRDWKIRDLQTSHLWVKTWSPGLAHSHMT